jgi:hypothetical protein
LSFGFTADGTHKGDMIRVQPFSGSYSLEYADDDIRTGDPGVMYGSGTITAALQNPSWRTASIELHLDEFAITGTLTTSISTATTFNGEVYRYMQQVGTFNLEAVDSSDVWKGKPKVWAPPSPDSLTVLVDDDDLYTLAASTVPALNSGGTKQPGLATVGSSALPNMQSVQASSDPGNPLNAFYSDVACSGLKTRFLQIGDQALQFADGPSKDKYLAGSNCLWAVATIPGYQMRVQFERFDLEQPANFVRDSDGGFVKEAQSDKTGGGKKVHGKTVCGDFIVVRETTENIMSCSALREQIMEERIGAGDYDKRDYGSAASSLAVEQGGGDPLTHGPFCGDAPPQPFTSGSNELVVQFCSDSGRDSVAYGFRGAFSVTGQADAVAAAAAEGGFGMGLEIDIQGGNESVAQTAPASDAGDNWGGAGVVRSAEGTQRGSGAMVAVATMTVLLLCVGLVVLHFYKRHLTRSFESNWMDWNKPTVTDNDRITAPVPSTAGRPVTQASRGFGRSVTRMHGEANGVQLVDHGQLVGDSMGYIVSSLDIAPPPMTLPSQTPPPTTAAYTTQHLPTRYTPSLYAQSDTRQHSPFQRAPDDSTVHVGNNNQQAFNALTQPEAIQML